MFHIWFSWDVEEFPSPEELPLHSSAKHSLYCFILCRKNSICFSDSSLSQLSHTGAANMEQAVGHKEETSSKQVIAMDVTHCNLLWDPNPWFTVSLPTALHCQGADTLSLFSHLEYLFHPVRSEGTEMSTYWFFHFLGSLLEYSHLYGSDANTDRDFFSVLECSLLPGPTEHPQSYLPLCQNEG